MPPEETAFCQRQGVSIAEPGCIYLRLMRKVPNKVPLVVEQSLK